MLKRLSYTVTKFIEKRDCLRSVVNDRDKSLDSVNALTIDYLSQSQIRLVALDFDGVLSYHGSATPNESVTNWLKKLIDALPLVNFCIYSNNLFPDRVKWLQSNFPKIDIIYPSKKKPYPDNLLELMSLRQIEPTNVLIVDDRLSAGILVGCLIGSHSLLIQKPFVNYHKAFVKESFYVAIRFLERLLLT